MNMQTDTGVLCLHIKKSTVFGEYVIDHFIDTVIKFHASSMIITRVKRQKLKVCVLLDPRRTAMVKPQTYLHC